MSGSALAIEIVLSKTAEFFDACDRPTALAGVPDMSLPCMRTLSALKTRTPAALVLAIVLPETAELETGDCDGWNARPTAPCVSWNSSSPPVSSGAPPPAFKPMFTNALLRTATLARDPAPPCWIAAWQVSAKRLSSMSTSERDESVPAGRPMPTAGGAIPGRQSVLLNDEPRMSTLLASTCMRELPVKMGPPSSAVPASDVRVRPLSMTRTVSSCVPFGTTTTAGPGGAISIA